jgi:NAD(P)-dependent dehydrogenase (short-subunit alcohol dehydrogenase family)
LRGRVAIVTGGGRGIGAAVARKLAEEGAFVVVNDLGTGLDGTGADVSLASKVVDEITTAGGTAIADTGDVSDFDSSGSLIQTAIDIFGKLDILVNVAGILRNNTIVDTGIDEWDAVIRVHLRGTFSTSHHAAVYWQGLGDSTAAHRLINFTSRSGILGHPGQANYAAAKMGVIGLTFSCANALSRYGVTSNAIAPTAITRMWDSVPNPDLGEEKAPTDVATVVASLARKDSSWCNGRIIGASGRSVMLYSTPAVISRLVATDHWDTDGLSEAMRVNFGDISSEIGSTEWHKIS